MENNQYNVSMSMNDIEEQRNKLFKKNENVTSKVKFNVKNYLNLDLKKGEKQRKIRIRILNITPSSTTPFMILKTHSMKVDKNVSKSGFKTFICLNDSNLNKHDDRGCPLCNEAKKYFEESKSKQNDSERKTLFKRGCEYKSKDTFILRVIDRDHEDEGVKFWRFNAHSDGTGCYDKLMAIYDERMQESINAGRGPYNVFDLNNGKDFTITLSSSENSSKVSFEIIDAGFTSPLSTNVEQALSWINDTKTWFDIYSVKDYSYLEVIANDGVPVYDKEKGCFIDKDESDKNQQSIIDEAQKILNNATISQDSAETKTESIQSVITEEEINDGLPF